jgi:catechol 2,3-dioxygenase-like lactoylglutathione lyase family enzyme
MTSTPALFRLSHFGLCVSDLERSLRFYGDGLGFDVAERYELDSETMPGLDRALEIGERVTVTSQFIRLGTLGIELLEYSTPAPSGAPSATRAQLGLSHLAFHVDDVEASVAKLVACGGTVIESTRAELGVPLVFLHDPDGVRIELMQVPARPPREG